MYNKVPESDIVLQCATPDLTEKSITEAVKSIVIFKYDYISPDISINIDSILSKKQFN